MKNLFTIFILIIILSASALAQPQQPDTLWTKRYREGYAACGRCVQQTPDGGYILVGNTSPGGQMSNFYLVKTDANGDTIWTRNYGTGPSEQAYYIERTSDGGYIVVGTYAANSTDIWLMKTDENGDTLWTRKYGETMHEVGKEVHQTDDGGYIIFGLKGDQSPLVNYFLMIKTDENGDTLWTRTYIEGAEICRSGVPTSDGGYIMAGLTESYGAGGTDFFVIKTDSEGDTLWTRTYGGVSNEGAESIRQTTDGGYIIAGGTRSYGAGRSDARLIKTDMNGDTIWTRTFGGSEDENGKSVFQTHDGGYIMTGYTETNAVGSKNLYLVRTDSLGNECWQMSLTGGIGSDEGEYVIQTDGGGFTAIGRSQYSEHHSDMWLVRLASEVNRALEIPGNRIPQYSLLPIYPNPFNQRTVARFELRAASYVNLEVYDVWGRVVENLVSGYYIPGAHRVWFDGGDLPSGVYLIRLEAGDYTQTRKSVLIK